MTTRIALAGLTLMCASMAAQAETPSYNFLDLNYVVRDGHDSANAKGGELKVSGLIAPYVYFNAGYEYLEFDLFGESAGHVQTGLLGLGGRLPLVPNLLDLAGGLDYLYSDISADDGFESDVAEDDDGGMQASLGVRANFNFAEVNYGARYLSLFGEEDVIIGLKALGRLGYGIWLTAGIEYSSDTEDQRYTAGFRLYLD